MSAAGGPATVGECDDAISEAHKSDGGLRYADIGFETRDDRSTSSGISDRPYDIGFAREVEDHFIVN